MSCPIPIAPFVPSLTAGVPGTMVPHRAAPTPEDWERHRPLIKRLYVDENKKLKEVAHIMAAQYGHFATLKMYRDRTKKWKLGKNNKESDMFAIFRKKNERDAIGKQTSFRVRGKVVTMDQVHQYLNRKTTLRDQDVYNAPTPSDVSYRTPSPIPMATSTDDNAQHITAEQLSYPRLSCQMEISLFPSSRYVAGITEVNGTEDDTILQMTLNNMYNLLSPDPSIPRSPSAPQTLLIPEYLLLTIKTYVNGSFEKGTWFTDENGLCTTVSPIADDNPDLVFQLESHCNTALQLLEDGFIVEFRRTISKAFGIVLDLFRSGDPQTLHSILSIFLLFRQKGRLDIVKMLRNYIYDIASGLYKQRHPWLDICRFVGRLEEGTFEEAVVRIWKCLLDAFEKAVGSFHCSCLDARLNFIRRVHGSVDPLQEERLLRGLLAQCNEGESDTLKKQALMIIRELGLNLCSQERYIEAEKLGEAVLTRAEEQDWYVEKTNAVKLIAWSQYFQDKRSLAENSLRQVVKMMVDGWGRSDPSALYNMIKLEGWLRNWGREEEANELKIEIDKVIGKDESNEELDGR
ncbi:uncharacterized protein PAC_12939 [Phialocephala subalpina]|uniref:Clr5 domain-containing protein n=1 Tax=Phialocephala subalpina TaxID=576137 RepID=A0A1L7XDF2_9HELO|nr:uncharacterized protein PAC_12939 [Phialocephala subalpina]